MAEKLGKIEKPSVEEFKKAYENISDSDQFLRNKILNEIEISQKKTMLQSKVSGFGVNLSNRCDLKCKMCQIWKKPWDLPQKTIQEIIDCFPYIEVVFWQGGEVFLLDYQGDLYSRELTVDIIERLRDEKKFSSVDKLIKQMEKILFDGLLIRLRYELVQPMLPLLSTAMIYQIQPVQNLTMQQVLLMLPLIIIFQ